MNPYLNNLRRFQTAVRAMFLLVLCFTLGSVTLNAQPNLFRASYGNSTYNEGVASVQLSDSTFIIVGNSTGFMQATAPYLCRIDHHGGIMYDVMISRPFLVVVTAVQLRDSCLWLTGFAMQQGVYKSMLMRVNLAGDVLMETYWGGNGWSFARDLVITSDYLICVAGESTDSVFGDMDATVTCLDTNGVVLWQQHFGDTGNDHFNAIDTGHAQTLIMAGATSGFGTGGDSAFYAVNCDMAGNLIWQMVEDYPGPDVIHDIHPDQDSGYRFCGYSYNWPWKGMEGILGMINDTGAVAYINPLGHQDDDAIYSLLMMKDGTSRMAGFYVGPFSFGKKDFILMNADQTGWWNPGLASAILGGHQDEIAYHILPTLDGGLLLTGTTWSIGLGITHIYLVRTDSMGNSGAHLTHQTSIAKPSVPNAHKLYSCYPNPASDQIFIQAEKPLLIPDPKGIIRDLSGRVLLETSLRFDNESASSIDIQHLPSGMYFLQIGDETLRFIRR